MKRKHILGAVAVLGVVATGAVAAIWYVAWVRTFDWQDDSWMGEDGR